MGAKCSECKHLSHYRVSKGMYGKCCNENAPHWGVLILITEHTQFVGCGLGEAKQEVYDGDNDGVG